MGLKLVTAPANNPVTLTEAKSHLRVDSSDDDTLIEALIEAATAYADGPRGFLGRALIDQTWDLYLDAFPDDDKDTIELPLPPLISVTGVYYQDSAGAEQTMSTDDYVVDTYSEPARIVLASSGSWPAPAEEANAVRIRFRAGYLDNNSPAADNVPGAIKAAILLMVGDLYANREETLVGNVGAASFTVERLLRPYKFHLSFA